jgi:hypothetical protein
MRGITMDAAAKPSVLFVYYTYTQQTRIVVEAMAEVLRGRGCEVQLAAIEFVDPRSAKRFEAFPMPHPFLEVLGMIPAELRRRPGQIRIPDVVTARRYDLVCVGSPTWWLSTNVPIRSFSESDAARQALNGTPFAAAVACRRYWRHNLKTVRKMGTERGSVFADGVHFRYVGGQVRSLLALVSYLGSGEYRRRYLGIKNSADQSPGVPPAGGTRLRRPTGKSSGVMRTTPSHVSGLKDGHRMGSTVRPVRLLMSTSHGPTLTAARGPSVEVQGPGDTRQPGSGSRSTLTSLPKPPAARHRSLPDPPSHRQPGRAHRTRQVPRATRRRSISVSHCGWRIGSQEG